MDDCAGNLTVAVSGNLNTNLPGTYTVSYTATDPGGNSATTNRTVRLNPNSVRIVFILMPRILKNSL